MTGKLVKYIAESGALTLVILLENGEEISVPINSVALPTQLSADIDVTNFLPLNHEGPSIEKITRTFDTQTGAFLTVCEELDNGQTNSCKYIYLW